MNILIFVIVLTLMGLAILILVWVRRMIRTSSSKNLVRLLSYLEGMLIFNSPIRAVLEIYFSLSISTMYQLT